MSQPFEPPNGKNQFTFCFMDLDQDSDLDYLLGYVQTNLDQERLWTSVLYFQNFGTAETPDWQEDRTRFTYFLDPDSLFYAPNLVDIDQDGDYDLFLQKRGKYTFYERRDTAEENWQEKGVWLSEIEELEHYSTTFADLTRDGLQDLVFGEFDGTLTLYQNVGERNHPAFKLVENAFVGIDVDTLAAPAFADLDGDRRLDLVVGNGAGFVSFYRNESTVEVSAPDEDIPVDFCLFQNYPNPFNPETTIEYELGQAGQVQLSIYNVRGQRVRTLVDEWQPAGAHQITWDGKSEDLTVAAPSGIYFYEIKHVNLLIRRKMALIR